MLLKGGDFIEGDFGSLHNNRVHIQSALLGSRSYAKGTEADAVIVRELEEEPRHRANYKIETIDAQIFFAKTFQIADGHFHFDSPLLGKHKYPPEQIRRIGRTDLP